MIEVTLIRPKGCAHCEQAKYVLKKLKGEYKITLKEVDTISKEGQKLVQKYNIIASPGILINNEFFAMGGATEEQFRKGFNKLIKKK